MALTEKQNYLMALAGEQPEWIPFNRFDPDVKGPSAGASPAFLMQAMDPNGDHKDIWGVEYITSKEAAGGMIPKTWDFLLDDITKWRDVIKAPDISGYDFEQMAKKDLERIDRVNQAVAYDAGGNGLFQHLMAFMGFTEGLCALYEEPEECDALFDYLTDFYVDVVKRSIDFYQPDILSLGDDTAAWNNPFISLDMMQHFFIPQYKRLADFAHERNIPITFHDCGKCEIFIPDLVEVVGISGWNPAQNCNDLKAIKKRFGNRLVLTGCINSSQTFEDPEITEEEIYDIVWDVANTYAPGGGFSFQAFFIIPDPTDQHALWKKKTVYKAMEDVSKVFYKQ